jgi:hypothetical protein
MAAADQTIIASVTSRKKVGKSINYLVTKADKSTVTVLLTDEKAAAASARMKVRRRPRSQRAVPAMPLTRTHRCVLECTSALQLRACV